MPFAATWMDPEIITLSVKSYVEWYVESKKKWYKWTYLQNRNKLTDIENKNTVTKGERSWGRDKLGVWD